MWVESNYVNTAAYIAGPSARLDTGVLLLKQKQPNRLVTTMYLHEISDLKMFL